MGTNDRVMNNTSVLGRGISSMKIYYYFFIIGIVFSKLSWVVGHCSFNHPKLFSLQSLSIQPFPQTSTPGNHSSFFFISIALLFPKCLINGIICILSSLMDFKKLLICHLCSIFLFLGIGMLLFFYFSTFLGWKHSSTFWMKERYVNIKPKWLSKFMNCSHMISKIKYIIV